MNRLKYLKELREQKQTDMSGIMSKCSQENRSRTTEEKTRWETLKAEVESMKDEISALEEQEAIDTRSAKPVGQHRNQQDNSEKRYLNKAQTISVIDSKTKLVRDEKRNEVGLGGLILAKIRGPINDAEERALTTSLDTSGGISTTVSRSFWDSARAQSTVVRAGATTLDFENDEGGSHVIPQIVTDPVAEWKVQNVASNLSDGTFAAKTFNYKTLFASTQISNELAQDGGSLFASMIEASLSRSFASEIDRAALLGSGAGEEPQGLALKAINAFDMGTNGGDLEDFNPLVGACRMIMDDNIPLEQISGFIMAPRTWQDLATLKSATELQQLLIPEQIRQIPWYVSSKIPVNQTEGSASDATSIYVGDWSQLVIGVRLNIRVKFHEQPLAQSFSTLVTCAARVDFEAVNLGAFCRIHGITPGGALT